MDQKFVIVRCTQAGVHAGYLVSTDRNTVVLRDSRRLWYWRVPPGRGAFLSGVAVHGLDPNGCKIGDPVAITLTEVCEIIDATKTAEDSIISYRSHERTK